MKKSLLCALALGLGLSSQALAFQPEQTVYTTQDNPALQPFCVTRESAERIAASGVNAGFLFMRTQDCQLANPGQHYRVQTRRYDLDPALNVRRVHILGDDGQLAVAVWFITGVDKEE